jgi:hypothetical protein
METKKELAAQLTMVRLENTRLRRENRKLMAAMEANLFRWAWARMRLAAYAFLFE